MLRPHTKILQMSSKIKITLAILAAVTLLMIIVFSVQFFYFQNLLKNNVLSHEFTLALNSIVISVLGIMLSLIVLWYVTRRVILPLLQLSDHIDSFGTGKQQWQPIEMSTGDEIERLANVFNASMGEVQNAKQMLKDERDFFSGIIQNAAAPMFVIDRHHNIIFWNNALAGLTGFSSSQMIGTNRQWTPFYNTIRPVLADLVIDHSLNRVDEYYSHHSSSLFLADSLQAEGWYENLGGKRRYIFFEAAPIINSNNEIIAAVETLEDITDRKLAQEESATHSVFLREIMNAIPNPVYYKNIEGNYLGCNAAFKQFFNKTEEQIIGRKLQDIMHEEYTGHSLQKDQDIINSCRSVQYETDLIRNGGEKRRVLVSKAPFSHSDGSLAGIVGAFVDITDQKRMDDQVRKMSRALEQSPATIVITNLDGVIEYVNPKFCQTTGYTVEEAIGQHTRVLKSGEMSPEGYTELWNTISSGKEWRGEFHNVRKDGSLYWEFASISPLFDKDGGITGYLAVKEDITGRKEAEASLYRYRQELENKHAELKQVFSQVEQAKQEWENTLDHLRDFVILTDNKHHVRRYNRLLAEMSGKTAEELVGEDWRILLTDAGFTFVAFNGVSGEVFHGRSGRSYDLNIFEIQEDGVYTGLVVSINDTTELRLAGQELQKAYAELKDAQMQIFQQEKMASIGQLAAGVAHEINNPMGFISSNLGTLKKYVDRLSEYIAAGDQAVAACGDSVEASRMHDLRKRLKIEYIMDDARQLIEESQDGAGRVRRIVQDLKSFSRVDQSVKGLINLNETLETTINIAWNEIKYVAALNREFGDIPEILCFPQQLNQVFLNLLVNAAHAMGENQGTITVRTWSEKENVFVSVADTGCGIPDEIRHRIFEPFFTTKEVGKGTGLGLSISYEIIRKHGGEISVESEVGQGTTFIVRLPVDGLSQEQTVCLGDEMAKNTKETCYGI